MTRPEEIDERAARVAGIEGRIGLDDIVDEPAVLGAQRPADRTDDAGRHGRLESQRIADGDGDLPRAKALGIGERRKPQLLRRLGAQHGQVGIGIAAENADAMRRAVGEGQADGLGAFDDVIVGEDQAVRRDDDAAARAGAGSTTFRLDLHVDDRGRDLIDDIDDGGAVGIEQGAVVDGLAFRICTGAAAGG